MIDINTFLTTQDEKVKIEFVKQAQLNPENYFFQLLQNNKNCAYALSVLTKKSTVISLFNDKFENLLAEFFISQDAKIRKYAYIIAGNYPCKFTLALLDKAIDTEQTFYTYPSLMLAMPNEVLAQKLLAKTQNLQEQIAPKIYDETVQNFYKVCPVSVHDCTVLTVKNSDFLVTTQKQYEDFLCEFLPYKKTKTKAGIVCKNLDLQGFTDLCKRRDIYQVLLIVKNGQTLEQTLKNCFETLKTVTRNNPYPIGYRIDCDNKILAQSAIKLSKSLSGENFINSPSNYSVTVKLEQDNCYLKFENFNADFSYRTEFLPASINPITANIIVNIAKRFNPKAVKVLDPCCGTATMLAERYFTNPNIICIGSDINPTAIKKARINLANAKINAKLSVCDIANSTQTCDEIICNLPYGLRVGSHTENAKVYSNLIKICKKYLVKGGFAFLYTADKKLLRETIKKSGLTLVQEIPFISGGLYCNLFIVKN